jgi:hypothetical protein
MTKIISRLERKVIKTNKEKALADAAAEAKKKVEEEANKVKEVAVVVPSEEERKVSPQVNSAEGVGGLLVIEDSRAQKIVPP